MFLMLLNAFAGCSLIPNPNQQWGVRRNYATREGASSLVFNHFNFFKETND